MSLLSPPRLPEIDAGERIRSSTLTIAVVDSLAGAPIGGHLAAAFAPRRVVRTRVLMRHKPGFDLQNGAAASHPDALLEAARALLTSLPEHDVLLVEGAALLAALNVRLAILGAPSSSLVALDPDVRGLRERFDLVIHELRPRTLDLVVHALAQPVG